jgi:hypothetical protein
VVPGAYCGGEAKGETIRGYIKADSEYEAKALYIWELIEQHKWQMRGRMVEIKDRFAEQAR